MALLVTKRRKIKVLQLAISLELMLMYVVMKEPTVIVSSHPVQ